MKELHDLRDKLCDELKDYGRKDLTNGTLEMLDTLTHTIKNLDKIIEADGYSGNYPDTRIYRGSYARGRDSMGRYSRTDINGKLHELFEDADDDRTREEIRRLIEKM